MKPTISKPFKSNDRTFDKVYNTFDKRDYFNSQGLAKVQIGNFERALKKNDKGAQQILDMFKGDEKKAKDYITQVISDRNKERAFNNYKALKDAVDSIQKGKPNVGAVDYVKRIIHNSSQKYSIALYSTLRNKKFTKWKDVHNDIDDLIGEGFSSDAQRKAAFANGYEEKDKKNEGKKRFKRQDGIGKAKYTISYHDGKKKHKDGSDFFDIKIFKNKKDLSDFVGTLAKQGYKLTRESVNEAAITYGIEYKSSKNDRKFKKASLTKTTHNPNIDKMMIKAISKDAKSLAKQDGWVDYRITKDGVPVKESVNENRFFKAFKDFFSDGGIGKAIEKEVPTFGQVAKKYKKKSDFIKWFVKSQAKMGVVFKNDGYGAYMMNRMGRIWDRVHGQPEDKNYAYESLNEVKEPEVISQLRDIVKRKQNKKIKDPISGKMMRVDLYSASAITKVYDAINKSNKDKFGKLSLPKMVNVAFSVMKKESVNEAKYYNKADALTAYFKGKIDAKELDKIARNDFKSGIATKKELSNFLSNKFTQDVMSDTYGIPAGTLVKRVRGLMKFAEGVTEDKNQITQLKKQVGNKEIKFYDALSKLEKKMGKKKYRDFLVKSLKDFKINGNHYDYRTNASAEEKLFQIS